MSMQDALFTVSSLSFVACGILFVLAIHTYTRENMREVFDDLSGRRRQRGIEQALLAKRGSKEIPAARTKMWESNNKRRRGRSQGGPSVTRAASALAYVTDADHSDATLAARDQAVSDEDKTMVANAAKFCIVSKTVLCGTADVVEGRDA